MIGLNGILRAYQSPGELQAQSDFIPAPSGGAPPSSVPPSPSGGAAIDVTVGHMGLDTTKLVIGVALIIVIAVILFFIRGGIKNALVSRKVSLDAANFAGSTWALYLLIFLSLIVFGMLGNFFSSFIYSIGTGVVGAAGLVLSLIISANATKVRK